MVKAIAKEIITHNAERLTLNAERSTIPPTLHPTPLTFNPTPYTFNLTPSTLIETIYFGGGTPSLLSGDELKMLLEAIHATFNVSSTAEITLETNPDDHTEEMLDAWKAADINRLSIGVQSFFEEDLVWMNRAHNAIQSIDCIKAAQAKGFHNLTIDLIYGIPGLTDERWKYNFETAVGLGIPHLSCYALTVEPKTALDMFIAKGQSPPVDAGQQANQFMLLMDWAAEAGFEHYEISNFAKPGHRSRHNSNYWSGVPYYGFGPSAHSFDGDKTRWWNVANNALYVQSIENKLPCFESEVLTPVQQQNEYVMTGLRTVEGLESTVIGQWSSGQNDFGSLLRKAKKWEQQGKVILNESSIKLTNAGKLFADGIASDLFVE